MNEFRIEANVLENIFIWGNQELSFFNVFINCCIINCYFYMFSHILNGNI